MKKYTLEDITVQTTLGRTIGNDLPLKLLIEKSYFTLKETKKYYIIRLRKVKPNKGEVK